MVNPGTLLDSLSGITGMLAMDDRERDITNSASPTSTVPSIHQAVLTPPHSVMSPLRTEAQPEHTPIDIEHVFVQNDPREWSQTRKAYTLVIISSTALIATIGVNIFNPAINDIKTKLHATDQEISLSLSVPIFIQGMSPLLWSAISEIQGRKVSQFVYLVSITIFVAASSVAGSVRSIGVLIPMRIIQAFGAGALQTIGAATLADIYEPQQRGAIVGIFYAAPLLGPCLAPFLGGALTQLLSWRATFYFAAVFAGTSLLMFLFFKDTFRHERSLLYQGALHRHLAQGNHKTTADLGKYPPHPTQVRLNIKDVNPIPPLIGVLRRRNNLAILLPSALLFGFNYCINYTIVRTFSAAPYHYRALDIGLVLLSNGIGGVVGSILGGRWSDHMLAKLKAANGGRSSPEDRLQSTKPMLAVLPLSLLGYAWTAENKVHIMAVCTMLFFSGVSSIWMYASTLAYIVDANAGRSSTAVASNAVTRGFMGLVAAEVAVPLQNALGDGGLYTLWAGLMVLVAGMLMLTMVKGARWREGAEKREHEREEYKKSKEGRP